MDERENQEITLDEILREFGVTPPEPEQTPEEPVQEQDIREEQPEDLDDEILSVWNVGQKQTPDLEQTRRMEPVDLEQAAPTHRMDPVAQDEPTRRMEPIGEDVTGDTIRLDDINIPVTEKRSPLSDDTRRIWNPGESTHATPGEEGWQQGDTIHAEAFTGTWEPEYEQPIGEYVPPKPIQFNPRSRFRELKKKLIEGPERRYYQLMERGIGKQQAAIFFSLLVVLVCAASTAMYAMGMVQENRMRLMVFVQFISILISAFLGSDLLIDGVGDMFKKRFTLNSMLAITFFVCCVDGVLCLKQVRVPCCAAFSLEMTMALWSSYHRRAIEMSQMDTLRKATRLDGVAAEADYMDGKKGFLRKQGEVEDFMDRYEETSKPEKVLNIYCLIALVIALGAGVFAGVKGDFSAGIQVFSVSLLAAVPATAFITHTRPTILLERRLHKLGTVICGWQGVTGLCGKAVFPVTFDDL